MRQSVKKLTIFIFSALLFPGWANALPLEETKDLNCYAATASMRILIKAIKTVKEGNPLPNMSSSEQLPEFLDTEIKSSLRLVETKFPDSPEHVANFHNAIAGNLSEFGNALASGEAYSVQDLYEKTKPCRDDYKN